MIYARTDVHPKALATPGARGHCPVCGGETYARCGPIVVHHWAHVTRDCDPWTEPETPWHVGWKARFPTAYQEVVVPPHRADVRTKTGLVIEIQHSAISSRDVVDREAFYRWMVWVFDARKWLLFVGIDRELQWQQWRHISRWTDSDLLWRLEHPRIPQHALMWKRARKTVLLCKRPIYLDAHPDVLLRVGFDRGGLFVTPVRKERFMILAMTDPDFERNTPDVDFSLRPKRLF